jgi:hypothetical protein
MGWFIFWLFCSILVAAFASSKKRTGLGWFFLSLLISPLIAFIIVLVLGPPRSTLKKCPNCAEEVKVEARVCRFCGYKFTERNEESSLSLQQQEEPVSKVEPEGVKVEKEGEQPEEEKMLDKEAKAEKGIEKESQIKGKSIPKFSNREEYEKWKVERLKEIDKKDK